MAKNFSPFGISVSYVLDDEDPANDHIIVNQKRRVEDGDDEIIGTRKYFPSKWGPTCKRRGVLYGASKIYQDRTSDESKDEGRLDSMDAVDARLAEDHWEKERESTGRTVRIEVEALAAIKGVTVAAIQKALREYADDAREKILSSKAVQDKVEELQASQEQKEESFSLDDLAA